MDNFESSNKYHDIIMTSIKFIHKLIINANNIENDKSQFKKY